MARDCTADRVMLSTHMAEHWDKVGYRPDTTELNEVDVLDIQIGRGNPDPCPPDSLRPDHTAKYTSVLIRGFSRSADEKDIYNILIEGGLPANYKIEDIKKDDKTGKLVIDNLDPEVCVSLSKHIHEKQFFSKKVFVSSVVQKTPSKEPTEPVAPDEEPDGDVSDSGSESSISEVDEVYSAVKPPTSRLFSKLSDPVKRPAQASPEMTSETKKKDKKKEKRKS